MKSSDNLYMFLKFCLDIRDSSINFVTVFSKVYSFECVLDNHTLI